MKNSFQWYPIKREQIGDFTLARGSVKSYFQNSDAILGNVPSSGLTVGFTKETRTDPFVSLFVVSESDSYDLFSWISTFLPEAFPLSQFARVIAESDVRNLLDLPIPSRCKSTRSEQWSSIVLGELLGQGGTENEVISVPYSRAAACFSTTMARAWMLYDSESVAATATKRLRKIESDGRFVRRSVTLQDMSTIWEVMNQVGDSLFGESPEAVVTSVCRNAVESRGGGSSSVLRLFSLDNYPGLRSASVEERVITFQRLITHIRTMDSPGDIPALAAIIAGAVFLVGKGTSHAFLLKRVPFLAPAANAWFGLIAALAGSSAWDTHWQRTCRGIEKVITHNFRWHEPVLADLAWAEYDWMASVFDSGKVFETASRTVAKVLSVEVLPGAVCQVRLNSSSEDSGEAHRKSAEGAQPSKMEKELESSLLQFLQLAEKIQGKFKLQHDSPVTSSAESQPSLFEGDKYLSSKPPKKGRKPYY